MNVQVRAWSFSLMSKPLVSHIDKEAQKDEFRNILKPIYSNLKGCDR